MQDWSKFELSVGSNPDLLWVCFTTLYDWFKIAPYFLDQSADETITNGDSLAHVFPRFAYMYLLLVLIGSLDCLCP